MAKRGQSPLDTKGTQNEYSRKLELVERVLGDPSLFPDDFKSWIVRWLYGNVNFTIAQGQLPQSEKSHLVGASGEIPFQNGWVNYGGANEPALYWKDPFGVVHLGGTVKNGTVGTTVFTLPPGYRPQYTVDHVVMNNGAFGAVNINPDGTVTHVVGGSNVYLYLSGITFRQFA